MFEPPLGLNWHLKRQLSNLITSHVPAIFQSYSRIFHAAGVNLIHFHAPNESEFHIYKYIIPFSPPLSNKGIKESGTGTPTMVVKNNMLGFCRTQTAAHQIAQVAGWQKPTAEFYCKYCQVRWLPLICIPLQLFRNEDQWHELATWGSSPAPLSTSCTFVVS